VRICKRTQNFDDAGAPAPWDWGVADILDTFLPCVFIQNCVALGQTVGVGRVTKIGRSGPAHWDRGRGWSPEAWIFFTRVICQIWSFYVKPYERNYGDLPEKFDPSPSLAFQLSRLLEVIGTDTDPSAKPTSDLW